jgi:sirohydrochlorin cobaltochelatase
MGNYLDKSEPGGLPDAFVLFAHGARDSRWSQTLEALAVAVRARAAQAGHASPPQVRLAFLELQRPTLEEAIDETVAHGARRIDILPVFWASGGHITHDLPPLLEAIRLRHPDLRLRELPVLSELPGIIEYIAEVAVRGGR